MQTRSSFIQATPANKAWLWLTLGIVAIAMLSSASADPLDNWSVRKSPASVLWLRLAAGPDKILAAASAVKQTTLSTDGKVWDGYVPEAWESVSPTSHTYSFDLTYGNGVFVNAGKGIYQSRDGVTWQQTWNPSEGLSAIGYGNGLYVAIGRKGWFSRDLKNWQQSNLDNVHAFGVFCGGRRWVASLPAKTPSVAVSADGKTWQIKTLPGDGSPTSGTYGNGRYVVMGRQGQAWWSEDAANWRRRDTGTKNMWGVCWAGGRFIACGNGGRIVSSTDGDAWKEHTSGVTNGLLRIQPFKNTLVAVGEGGVILESEALLQ